jgi:putative ABC transport system substrate-binding protein
MIAAKLFELLREVAPNAPSIGLLVNPSNPNAESEVRDSQKAAETYGQKLVVVKAGAESDFATAFGSLVEHRAGALVVSTDPLFTSRYNLLASMALRHGLPTLSGTHEFTTAGGLMSYGTKLTDGFRLVGIYAGRILKGEKAANLPVQQTTKIELVINLNTAKALGITLPISLLGRADEVIE